MVSGAFKSQAQYQAALLNLTDVRVTFVRHPISDAAPAEIVGKAEESFGAVVKAIETDVPLPVPAWLEDAPQGCFT